MPRETPDLIDRVANSNALNIDKYLSEIAANTNAVRSSTGILEEALEVLTHRDEVYGPASDHYHELSNLQSAFFQKERTARDVVIANVLEKLDRIQRTDCDSDTFKDSFIDAINYLAIAWECS
jgi:glycosyltransferase A (GT-A) superfamily protein (DUF2064 family)